MRPKTWETPKLCSALPFWPTTYVHPGIAPGVFTGPDDMTSGGVQFHPPRKEPATRLLNEKQQLLGIFPVCKALKILVKRMR